MTIEQLKYFASIEQLNSFSEAAEQLYTSQSTISKQIKSLESELGFELFLRTTRKVELTGGGKLLSPYVKRILMEYDAMQEAARKIVGKTLTSIHIAAIPIIAQYGLVEAINEFSACYPHIYLQIKERDSDMVLQKLLKGEADIAILRSIHPELKYLKNLRYIPIVWDEVCLLVNSQHPLASRDEVSLRELSNESFYFLGSHTGISNFCISECAKVGFVPYIQNTELSRYTLQEIISTQPAVTLMAKKVAKGIQNQNIQVIPLKEHPQLDLSFVFLEHMRNEPLDDLMQYIVDYEGHQ